MAETFCRVGGHVPFVPRETKGLKVAAAEGVAGDVCIVRPREAELPAIVTVEQLSGKALVSESIEQGEDGVKVSIHWIAFLVFRSVLDLFILRIIHEKTGKVKPKNRLRNAVKMYKLHN